MRVYYLPEDQFEAEIVLRFIEDNYYRQLLESQKKNPPKPYVQETRRCPVCGDLRGHSWGTGDCNCEVDQ